MGWQSDCGTNTFGRNKCFLDLSQRDGVRKSLGVVGFHFAHSFIFVSAGSAHTADETNNGRTSRLHIKWASCEGCDSSLPCHVSIFLVFRLDYIGDFQSDPAAPILQKSR